MLPTGMINIGCSVRALLRVLRAFSRTGRRRVVGACAKSRQSRQAWPRRRAHGGERLTCQRLAAHQIRPASIYQRVTVCSVRQYCPRAETARKAARVVCAAARNVPEGRQGKQQPPVSRRTGRQGSVVGGGVRQSRHHAATIVRRRHARSGSAALRAEARRRARPSTNRACQYG